MRTGSSLPARRFIAVITSKTAERWRSAFGRSARDQIEYPDEGPMIREKFESELARKGLQSVMPDEAYRDRDYEWSYAQKRAS